MPWGMTQRLSRRALQAQHTRRDIIGAARRCFAERGYRATAVKDIADQAGVSVQTVYDSVGSKASLVLALNDLLDADAGIGGLVEEAFSARSAREVARLPAAITRSILENAGDIVRIIVNAAATEPEVQQVLADGRARSQAGARMCARELERRGALRKGVGVDEASATMSVLGDASFGLMLLDDYSWTTEEIETWIAAAISRLVVR